MKTQFDKHSLQTTQVIELDVSAVSGTNLRARISPTRGPLSAQLRFSQYRFRTFFASNSQLQAREYQLAPVVSREREKRERSETENRHTH
jgi:hypothetical protein